MNCCPHCQDAEKFFNRAQAERDLRAYQRKGAEGTTKWLLDAILSAGTAGKTLLDIGGGIGVIQHELMAAGAAGTTDVDASGAYLQIAQQVAETRGYADKASYRHGDFVAMADSVEPADIVTLDRVICCYPHVEALVGLSSSKAKHLYGVVYPRDAWWMKMALPVLNTMFRLQRSTFRSFIHPSALVERIITENGFHKLTQREGILWQMVVYAR